MFFSADDSYEKHGFCSKKMESVCKVYYKSLCYASQHIAIISFKPITRSPNQNLGVALLK